MCPPNKFQCPNGRCINKANVCDGHCDCLRNNDENCADEINCSEFYQKNDGMIYFNIYNLKILIY